MDAILRLRVLIWVLAVGLWGVMVYQYLGEEEREAQMKRITNPYRGPEPPPSAATPEQTALPEPALPALTPETAPVAAAVVPAPEYVDAAPLSGPLPPPVTAPAPDSAPARPARPNVRAPAPSKPRLRVEDRRLPPTDAPLPAGFERTLTRHFAVFCERSPATEGFLDMLESLHSNLMLDLAPFSPWAADEHVTVFLFRSQDNYRRVTGRPPWSGGASSVIKRKVYVYESPELPGILAHELTHIYFDGFFLGGPSDPLWLSEGMATLVQVERGLAAPTWLRDNLRILESGRGLPLDDLVAVASTSSWPDEQVRLWYAQSYSVVRFLIRTQYRSSFYKFASHLRDGRPTTEALYRAYGAPYTRLKALEHAWRYELTRQQLARLGARGATANPSALK